MQARNRQKVAETGIAHGRRVGTLNIATPARRHANQNAACIARRVSQQPVAKPRTGL